MSNINMIKKLASSSALLIGGTVFAGAETGDSSSSISWKKSIQVEMNAQFLYLHRQSVNALFVDGHVRWLDEYKNSIPNEVSPGPSRGFWLGE
jgi:prepilin-type processing-associated H-X9-DG protein